METEKPNYYAVLTAEVRYDKRLTSTEKILYAEITALSSKTGECWASNKYFAELYELGEWSISKSINNLVKCGYLKSSVSKFDGNKRALKLIHKVVKNPKPSFEKPKDPYMEKPQHNNTSINNKYNNSDVEEKLLKFLATKDGINSPTAWLNAFKARHGNKILPARLLDTEFNQWDKIMGKNNT